MSLTHIRKQRLRDREIQGGLTCILTDHVITTSTIATIFLLTTRASHSQIMPAVSTSGDHCD
jgi:hypothetical protein